MVAEPASVPGGGGGPSRSGPHIVVAACTTADGSGLYPDVDWPALRDALGRRGVAAERRAWDDPAARWDDADAVVVRSTWTSVDRPDEFTAWVAEVGAATTIANPAPVLRWNLDKSHLRELGDVGIPVVPTIWVRPGDEWATPHGPFVVKPAISGGGRSTARYEPSEVGEARRHVADLHHAGRAVMVQPYLDAIDEVGECKMIFIGGEFSHALRVGPLLEAHAGILLAPWEKPVTVDAIEPNVQQLRLAGDVLSEVQERFGTPPLYARVDVVGEHVPRLLELELVDPSLSLWAHDLAADRLAAAIAALIRS